MQNLKNNCNIESNENYNDIPVYYCSHCLSLNIMILDDNTDYCDNCGSTDIESTDILTWEKLYKEKYKKDFNKE